ncbi:class I SAM-dependent methyltransferase [Synechococcales cyanobacterium C]|uniref:Class I SAM-dependent methyltransferase n=1 Tax=Petrachloros mirabilis ULC683 TaxID=2781853 RepID=A0A8K2A2W5_9CYAN|nr:class I SAM-dependent methyltransferase [Petrachloros mirabilis]NCJ08707.1 class I SAM-dependent methyltransferase [Petrachloros mirabilis ULC683]
MSNQLQSQLTGIPRTLLMTTRARVEEHQRPDAIFRDPKVAEWWPLLSWDAALDRFYSPIAQLTWAVRAKLFDQIAQRYLAHHPDAIAIELGAGLSTRYHRVGQGYRCWIELDLPEVTALRRRLDTETEYHRFFSRSVMDFSWMDELPVCSPDNLLIIAEGLLMYFEATQVREFIHQLQQRFPGTTLVFDALGSSPRSKGARQLAQLGAPLKWFIKNEQDVAAMGLFIVNAQSLIQENCRYPSRIGIYRWFPWISKLPPLRNACLVLETTLTPNRS